MTALTPGLIDLAAKRGAAIRDLLAERDASPVVSARKPRLR